MIPLLSRPPARFTFVVGKGGVGKSTAAAAFGLAWSAHGPVHLLSTDPAHSLGDVIGRPLPAGAPTRVCGADLTVEELDTGGRSRAWHERARGPLGELLRAGSYLGDEDVARFTALRLPGTDEVVAALRLVELAAARVPAVVVDTAPTAHTLRLLDAADVLGSWSGMLSALAAKADTVARALAGAVPPRAADAFLAELQVASRSFRERVLPGAAFLIATRTGHLDELEAAEVREELRRRGLRVWAVLRRAYAADGPAAPPPGPHAEDSGSEPPVVPVPVLPAPARGCEALAAWADHLGAGLPRLTAAIPHATVREGSGERWLAERRERLLLFAGKGGVGKSTCAAAAALALAETRPVLLLGADPAGSLPELLGAPVGTSPTPIVPGLRAARLDPAAALAEWRAALRPELEPLLGRVGLGGNSSLDRAVLQSIWDATPPGLDELVALSELLDLADAAETVVVDASPTGHFLRLLELPALAHDWTRALMRLLLEYGLAGELDALTERVLRFARQLQNLRSRLADAGWTGTVIVAIAEPVVEAESRRLADRLVQAGIPIAAVLTNLRADRTAALPLAVPHLVAPSCTPPPRGPVSLRRFTASWVHQ